MTEADNTPNQALLRKHEERIKLEARLDEAKWIVKTIEKLDPDDRIVSVFAHKAIIHLTELQLAFDKLNGKS
jgi:hypothetical protein